MCRRGQWGGRSACIFREDGVGVNSLPRLIQFAAWLLLCGYFAEDMSLFGLQLMT